MAKRFLVALTVLGLTIAVLTFVTPAHAATSFDFKNYNFFGCSGEGYLTCLADKLINSLLLLGVPLVGLMVLIGGIFIATSGGSKRAETGKAYIVNACIGYGVLIMAKVAVVLLQSILGTKT